jgi:hypothetical protein
VTGARSGALGDDYTNPALVLRAWCSTYLDRERLPDYRAVVRFDFADQPEDARHLWLLVEDNDAEVCKHHPGFDEDLVVETDARTFALWHMRTLSVSRARSGRGSHAAVRGLRCRVTSGWAGVTVDWSGEVTR